MVKSKFRMLQAVIGMPSKIDRMEHVKDVKKAIRRRHSSAGSLDVLMKTMKNMPKKPVVYACVRKYEAENKAAAAGIVIKICLIQAACLSFLVAIRYTSSATRVHHIIPAGYGVRVS
ncbi:MAG TPA: hypothetical protein PK646_00535 [Bacillota bacterium]|nr:hypothetical protein [Bacillota bacterium]